MCSSPAVHCRAAKFRTWGRTLRALAPVLTHKAWRAAAHACASRSQRVGRAGVAPVVARAEVVRRTRIAGVSDSAWGTADKAGCPAGWDWGTRASFSQPVIDVHGRVQADGIDDLSHVSAHQLHGFRQILHEDCFSQAVTAVGVSGKDAVHDPVWTPNGKTCREFREEIDCDDRAGHNGAACQWVCSDPH
eukprot:662712-Rhodomonas_salina.1